MGCILTKHTQSMSVAEIQFNDFPEIFMAREKEKPTRLNRWNYHDEVRHPGVEHPSVQRVIKICGI